MVMAIISKKLLVQLITSDILGFVNTTWNIAFSGRTSSKLMATHVLEQGFLAQTPPRRADDTYHIRQRTQEAFEQLSEVSKISVSFKQCSNHKIGRRNIRL